MPSDAAPLGVLLLSGAHDRVHYAYVLATGAAALGRPVVLFASNAGCYGMLRDWSGVQGVARDAEIVSRGVAGLDTLREAAVELGIRLIACEAGLRAEGLEAAPLMESATVAGIATFLSATAGGQVVAI